jgi:hypothetical protein
MREPNLKCDMCDIYVTTDMIATDLARLLVDLILIFALSAVADRARRVTGIAFRELPYRTGPAGVQAFCTRELPFWTVNALRQGRQANCSSYLSSGTRFALLLALF